MATDSVRDGDNNNNMAPLDERTDCVCVPQCVCVCLGWVKDGENHSKDMMHVFCQVTGSDSKSQRFQSLIILPALGVSPWTSVEQFGTNSVLRNTVSGLLLILLLHPELKQVQRGEGSPWGGSKSLFIFNH